MPQYKTHLFGAMVMYAVIIFGCSLLHTPPAVLLEWFLCMMFGSLFPDIDTKSMGQRLTYYLLFFIALVLAVKQRFDILGYLAFFAIIPLVVDHRGLFHRVWFIALLITGMAFVMISHMPTFQVRIVHDAIFLFIGALSHVWFDMGFKGIMRFR